MHSPFRGSAPSRPICEPLNKVVWQMLLGSVYVNTDDTWFMPGKYGKGLIEEQAQLLKYCKLDHATETLIRHAIMEFGLSARAYDRILRTARTIADLAGSENILQEHLFEAIGYRAIDRNS